VDGHGAIRLTLELSRLDTMDEIYSRSGNVNFVDPLREEHLIVRLSQVIFPVAGRYEFRLLADDQLVASRVLEVLVRR
jgi:hypothetical protein